MNKVSKGWKIWGITSIVLILIVVFLYMGSVGYGMKNEEILNNCLELSKESFVCEDNEISLCMDKEYYYGDFTEYYNEYMEVKP